MARIVVSRVRRPSILSHTRHSSAKICSHPTNSAASHICLCRPGQRSDQGLNGDSKTGIFIADVTVSFVVTRFSLLLTGAMAVRDEFGQVECNSLT